MVLFLHFVLNTGIYRHIVYVLGLLKLTDTLHASEPEVSGQTFPLFWLCVQPDMLSDLGKLFLKWDPSEQAVTIITLQHYMAGFLLLLLLK